MAVPSTKIKPWYFGMLYGMPVASLEGELIPIKELAPGSVLKRTEDASLFGTYSDMSMSMLTKEIEERVMRKKYDKLADDLSGVFFLMKKNGEEIGTGHTHLMEVIVSYLQEDNPRFQPELFMKAVFEEKENKQ